MDIPPFITNLINSSPSIQISDNLVHCKEVTNSFDAKHKWYNGFPKADEETIDVITFMGAASMGKDPATIYIDSLDTHVLKWAKQLHTETISYPVQTLIVDSNVSTPSNSSMSDL